MRYWGGVILLLSIAYLEQFIPIKIPAQLGEQTFLATAFYLTGYILKRMQLTWQKLLLIGTLLMFIPAVAAIFIGIDMNNVSSWQIPVYYIISIIGSLGILGISHGIQEFRIAPVMAKIGGRTLYILTFHFLAFKLVSWLYLLITNQTIEKLIENPVIHNTNSWMWVIYAIIGVAVPLLVQILSELPSRYINIFLQKES